MPGVPVAPDGCVAFESRRTRTGAEHLRSVGAQVYDVPSPTADGRLVLPGEIMTSKRALASCTLAGALACLLPAVSPGQDLEANKALARRFYENVWFSNNPAVVDDIVAPEYVIHDVGGVDGLREQASRATGHRGLLLAERRHGGPH